MAGIAHAGDVVDRIVATVNGHVILQSDWDDAVRFEAFMEGRPLGQVTDQDRGRALDRLIDQELLREQAQGVDAPQPSAEELKQKIADLKTEHSCSTPEAWRATLVAYGLDENELETRVAHEIGTLRQVEARLRPTVQIDAQTIESYYREEFLPKLRNSGAKEIPLAAVAGKIREILTEQKVTKLLSSWLQSLRAESKIHTSVANSSSPPPAGGQGQ
ncbi:MAG: SurA N-terminal domain-containing protein [Acidobacteria bacterium]|nr:SurA N-terminal domain-containing protein [Acidobacteriota bacterium]